MDYKKEFMENMNQLGKMHENSKVYVDFMDYYIYQNSNSPDRALPTGYKKSEMELFGNAYDAFVELMKELIREHGWYDFMGEYYEEFVLAGSKASMKGQFYTPRQISSLLSEIVGFDAGLNEAYDPACGSARNLCEYHSRHPTVRCTGEDLDESACKMAVINFSCHGVNGVVNWIDALTREYMGTSWKTLDGQIYITDMDWIRAVEDVRDGITLLSLSDDVWHDLMMRTVKVLGNVESDVSDEKVKVKGGLDAWL